jgi:ribonuclease HI
LGEWIVSSNDIRRTYPTYRDKDYVYTRTNSTFTQLHIQQRTTTSLQKLPGEVIPCVNTISGVIPRDYTKTPTPSQSKTHLDRDNLLNLPNKVIIVTNAFIHKEKAAIAWIVTSTSGQIIKTSQHSLEETHISLFRAEAYGVYSALEAMQHHLQQQQSKWTLYCDNKALIYCLTILKSSPVNIEWTDSDALLAIKRITPENGQFCHVKGHTVITEKSSLPERLNNIVDKKANDAIHDPPQSIQFNGVIKIFGTTAQMFSVRDVAHYCQMTVSRQYWQNRLGNDIFNSIDWEVYQQICHAQKQYNSIKKMLASITPTKQRLHKLDTGVSPICPICNNN